MRLPRPRPLALLLASLPAVPAAYAADDFYGTTEPFAKEAVYFVLTDRFVNGDPSNDHRDQGGKHPTFDRPTPGAPAGRTDNIGYLGGDFKGILDNAGYIRDMGFTPVWVTPIVDNPDEAFTGGEPVTWNGAFIVRDHAVGPARQQDARAGIPPGKFGGGDQSFGAVDQLDRAPLGRQPGIDHTSEHQNAGWSEPVGIGRHREALFKRSQQQGWNASPRARDQYGKRDADQLRAPPPPTEQPHAGSEQQRQEKRVGGAQKKESDLGEHIEHAACPPFSKRPGRFDYWGVRTLPGTLPTTPP